MAEQIREFVQINRDDLVLLLELGYSETYNENFDRAREIFNGVSAIRPDIDAPYVGLSNVEVVAGDRKAAYEHLQQALEANPRSAMAVAKLGELYYEDGDDEKAQEHFKKAVKMDPASDGAEFAKLFLDGIKEGSITRK